jgi:hypothetical protein
MFPAAVLIMFLLGALVVDVSLTQVRARELEAVAASAANDALAALDVDALRSGEGIVINESDAAGSVAESLAAGPIPDARVDDITVTRDAQNRTVIVVTLALDVDLVMAPAIGDLDEITLRRTGRAVIIGSDQP